uniref:Uncharacterized protein n=1 Tax=Moniliophthora roreri TaxID=221103 RepID=A0A0W0ETM1_MONRR
MQITRDRKRHTLSLDQSDYLEKIIKRFVTNLRQIKEKRTLQLDPNSNQ